MWYTWKVGMQVSLFEIFQMVLKGLHSKLHSTRHWGFFMLLYLTFVRFWLIAESVHYPRRRGVGKKKEAAFWVFLFWFVFLLGAGEGGVLGGVFLFLREISHFLSVGSRNTNNQGKRNLKRARQPLSSSYVVICKLFVHFTYSNCNIFRPNLRE